MHGEILIVIPACSDRIPSFPPLAPPVGVALVLNVGVLSICLIYSTIVREIALMAKE